MKSIFLLALFILSAISCGQADEVGPLTAKFSDPPTDREIFECHLFSEPMVPTGSTNADENKAFVAAMRIFSARSNNDDFEALTEFIDAHPASPWRASLALNLGIIYRNSGYFSRAAKAFREAWRLSSEKSDANIVPITDCAIGQLMDLQSKMGMQRELEIAVKELGQREVGGSARQNVVNARENLEFMQRHADHAFRCGAFALDNVKRIKGKTLRHDMALLDAEPTEKGYSLKQLKALAKLSGLKERIVKKVEGADFPSEMTVHWKTGHFSMIVAREGDRYCVRDPNFGHDIWVTKKALEEETSGYGLIEDNGTPLPAGFSGVSDVEGDQVWGGCHTGTCNPDDTNPCDKKSGAGCGTCAGMPGYAINLMLVSLNITDTPVSYTPPRGPAINITVSYNQRDANQPASFSYTNFGPLWTFNWLSYVIDDPTILASSHTVKVYSRGGGARAFNFTTSPYTSSALQRNDQSVLKLTSTSPVSYERDYPDGSKELFEVSENVSAGPRKVFLTKVVDAQGNTVQINYDASLKITSVTDAIGQSTTFTYGVPGDAYKVSKITDPFGRSAVFEYTGSSLTALTDAVGLRSTVAYSGGYVEYLTTPYGQSHFTWGEAGSATAQNLTRWLVATDPLGGQERVEFDQDYVLPSNQSSITVAANSETKPVGLGSSDNGYLGSRNTFYWSKKAMMDAPPTPGDYTTYAGAYIYHWLHDSYNTDSITGIVGSEKPPLESRIWYSYVGQSGYDIGTSGLVAQKGRILDDGSTQLFAYSYNTQGNMTKETGPAPYKWEKTYVYYPNGVDLKEVRQTTSNSSGTINDLLTSYGTYNALHEPLTITDAAGQTTTYTYNGQGQKTTSKVYRNSQYETTTWNYTGNYLTNVTGPVAGATTDYTYDAVGRVRTVTDSAGYKVTNGYDNLNRLVSTAFPDGTFTLNIYDRLDPAWQRDRLGRWTHREYDALRRLTAITDPENQKTRYDWCACGSLKGIYDPNNNYTSFTQDVQGRLKTKTYANAKGLTYIYENTTSRLKSILDAKSQTTTYAYNVDDTLSSTTYSGAQYATPNVSYTYDPSYNRLASMTDGTGTTQYTYKAVGTLGANQVNTVDGPLANDTIAYTYDELGRALIAKVNGTGNTVTYDALGRVATAVNPLGSFGYHYVGQTGRLDYVTRPGGQMVDYSYYGNTGDNRLSEIKNLGPSAAALSKFNYTYDAVGNIRTWTQQVGTAGSQYYDLGYNRADELLAAPLRDSATGTIVKPYTYRYDAAGNRTSEQVDNGVKTSGYNNLNQLKTIVAGGTLTLEGSVNEPSTVTVAGQAAAVDTSNRFKATVTAVSGANSVPITATDGSGNITSKTAQFTVSATSATLTYDDNGNLTGDGTKTYEWDAANRLLAVNYAGTGNRSEFSYDGLSRRTQIVEKTGGTVTSTKKFVWVGNEIAEERNASATVTKRYYPEGYTTGASGTPDISEQFYYVKDHLGSVRGVYNADEQAMNVYQDYDPFGRLTVIPAVDNQPSDMSYTGHYYHQRSGLQLALYRAYDGNLGRWLSRDPIGESGGVNLYGYVSNNPVNDFDPEGLCSVMLEKRDVDYMGPTLGAAAGLFVKHWFLKVKFEPGDLKCCKAAGNTEQGMTLETGLGEQGGNLPGQQYNANPFPLTQPVDHSGQSGKPGTEGIPQNPAAGKNWDCCKLYQYMTDRTPTGKRFPFYNCHSWACETMNNSQQ